MDHSPLPPKLKELAAGYVLGNLDPDELLEFQQLAAQYPEQNLLVAEMQDLISQLPFVLEPQAPPETVRDRLFREATTDLVAPGSSPQSQPKTRPWLLIAAVVLTSAIAGYSAWLQRELQTAQTTIAAQNQKLDQLQSQVPDATVKIKTSPRVLTANWNGISQVLDDHLRAQQKGAKAVEIQAESPPDLFQQLQAENFSLPQPTPTLSLKALEFLGGSICQFEKTKGVRVMYETTSQQPISFYQLQRAASPDFPLGLSEQLIIQNPSGPSMLIWSNDTFLFAIVADLSTPQLESLAATLEVQSGHKVDVQNL